MERILGTLVL